MTEHPWPLTVCMVRALDAVIQTGCDKLAAEKLGVSGQAISMHILRAKQRMGAKTRLLAVLAWDRYRRDPRYIRSRS